MLKDKNRTVRTVPQSTRNSDAVFVRWKKTMWGDTVPLYTILKEGHPSYRSTVTHKALRALHMRIPWTPSPYPGVGPSPGPNRGAELAATARAKEVIQAAGLDYTVVKVPLREVVKLNHADVVSDRWATVRTDTGDVLGIVGGRYEPIQNRDAFTFFDNLVETHEAIYEAAGTIGRGERMWILAKLPGFIKVRGNDIVSKYILLSNSHDGSSRVRARLTPIRVVCNNTLAAALKSAAEINILHTSNAAEGMEQARALLGLSNSLFKRLDTTFNRMALTRISDRQLLEYVETLVPDSEEEDNAKIQETRKAFLELHESGQGADLSRGTLWGAFNCVTEYTDHKMEGDPTTRLESIWFGRGEQLKLRAFQLAERMM